MIKTLIKNKNILFLPLVILLLIFTVACTATYEVKGEVYKKEYVPENTYMITTMSGSTPIITPYTDPEEWLVTIGNEEYDVPEEIFKKIDIGDYVEGIIDGTDDSQLTITK